MKSYVLAIALAMLVAAGFVFQNPGLVTVHFLTWTREIPQGVWEVVLFAAGGILMWGVSLVAMMEVRNKYRRETRSLERRVQELQEERDSLVNALNSLGAVASDDGDVRISREITGGIARPLEGEADISPEDVSCEPQKVKEEEPWLSQEEQEDVAGSRVAEDDMKASGWKNEGDQDLF